MQERVAARDWLGAADQGSYHLPLAGLRRSGYDAYQQGDVKGVAWNTGLLGLEAYGLRYFKNMKVGAGGVNQAFKPLGLASTGRTVAKNLTEQLAIKEIMSNPSSGKVLIQKMKDASGRWNGWSKMSNKAAHGIEIHYNALWENGVIKAVDDFKFISP